MRPQVQNLDAARWFDVAGNQPTTTFSALNSQEELMNRFGFFGLLMSGLMAACGDDDGGGRFPPGLAAGGVCTSGAACVDLGMAGDFVILSTAGITDVPTSPITGNVGSSPITGAAIHVTCAEVTGTIYAVDAAGPAPCSVVDGPKLTVAVNDMGTAFTDAPVTSSISD